MVVAESLDRTVIVESIQASTQEVFTTMLTLELAPGDTYMMTDPHSPSNGVIGLIGLAGQWVGTGCISCSAEFACRASSSLLMAEYTSVDDEVLDAMGEITNMIIGNVKDRLEPHVGQLGLSIPTVVFGRNFTARTPSGAEWVVAPFRHEAETFEVKVCLNPHKRR